LFEISRWDIDVEISRWDIDVEISRWDIDVEICLLKSVLSLFFSFWSIAL